ncbi:MAG TPA: FAD-dependent oxidoreductase [Streptosporangiaceae bacterium]|nr:FAD-dependent oxidoreductase [Streptosporangiaceae bacterium]
MTGRRIAVAGGGVAGLTAAYLLSRSHEVTLFEADDRLGGHADTHTVAGADGLELAVDTGFIVHNQNTYPLLTRLFGELGVATQPTEMSMSVRCRGCGLQYAGHRGPGGLLAGVSRGKGRYLRMLTEVRGFHRDARRLLADGGSESGGPTFGQFLDRGGYSGYFIAHFAAPFVAAVWSCPPEVALGYPARYLFTFLANHGLLSVTGSPPWRTVVGGSREYVRLIADRVTEVRTSAPVRAVRRFPGGVEVRDGADRPRTFDAIVIATHPDQALRLLADPTPAEKEVLGAFRYTANPAVLHTDASLLPTGRRVRSSWNYELAACTAGAGQVQISYYMNRLQRLPGGRDYVVTLNPGRRVGPEHVLARMDYEHPVYSPESVAAQRRLPGLSDAVTAYAGAYHGWGFHEDGCRSGVAAARALGEDW